MLLFQLDRPIGLIIAYGVLGALFMPFLAVTLLGLLNGSRVSAEWRNGPLTNAAMVVCAVVFVVLGASQLWGVVGGK
jgi:Mn2+/Fe2+ NRAMP family transporter